METKENIRRRLRAIRNQLSKEEVTAYSDAICNKLILCANSCSYDYFFVYSATQNEVDLTKFIQYAFDHAIKVAFPKVNGRNMDFYEVTEWAQLETGYFGIAEPNANCRKVIPSINDSVIVLVPGVAFTLKGCRIGYGKGFYDRYLTAFPWIWTIGVAYEKQICEDFPADAFDKTMDRVITDEREVKIND